MTKRNSLTYAEGFTIGAARAKGKKQFKLFHWAKLLEFMRNQAPNLESIEIGLAEDWDCTSDYLVQYGEFNDLASFYVKSNWATPIIVFEDKEIDCYYEVDGSDDTAFEQFERHEKETLRVLEGLTYMDKN